MDPATAISLTSSVAQLVEISWKIVSKSHEIYKYGADPEHRDIHTVTRDLQDTNERLLKNLRLATPSIESDEDQDSTDLRRLCESSNVIATKLIARLNSVSTGHQQKAWKSLRQALKSVWMKSELDDVASRLQAYRNQLNTRILVSVKEKVNALDQTAKNIIIKLDDSRVLSTTNLDIQTEYLSNHIVSQGEMTRKLFQAWRVEGRSPSPVGTARSPPPYEPRNHDDVLKDVFDSVRTRDRVRLRQILRDEPMATRLYDSSGRTALHIAAQLGDENLVLLLIRNGAAVNFEDNNDRLPLHEAVQTGSVKAVRALLAKGSDTMVKDCNGKLPLDLCEPSSLLWWILTRGHQHQVRDEDGLTALSFFAKEGKYQAVQMLLEEGAEVNTVGKNDLLYTPLQEAVDKGHADIVRLLLSYNADLHKRDGRKSTPLCLASLRGHKEVGEILLDHGADIDAYNVCKFTPLSECSYNWQPEMGVMLIERGARFDIPNNSGEYPIHLAALEDVQPVVEALLARGCDPDLPNSKTGCTALLEACKNNHLKVVKCLLKYGANINLRMGEAGGITILNQAVLHANEETVQYLLEAGANPNESDANGDTPLHQACQLGKTRVVVLLLDIGKADVNAVNKENWSALHEATLSGKADIVKALLDRGADKTLLSDWGDSPLALARQAKHQAVVRLLTEH